MKIAFISVLSIFLATNAMASDVVITKKLTNGKNITYYDCGREAAMETSFTNTYGDVNVCTKNPQILADRGIIPEDYFIKMRRLQAVEKQKQAERQVIDSDRYGVDVNCDSTVSIYNYLTTHNGNLPRKCNGLTYTINRHDAVNMYNGIEKQSNGLN